MKIENDNYNDEDVISLSDFIGRAIGRFIGYFILIFIDFLIAFAAGYFIEYFFSTAIIDTFALFGITIVKNQIPIICGCIGLLGSLLRGY